jgi:signal transduction histidine kinase
MSAEVQRRESSLRSQEELLRITLSTLAPAVMVLEAGGELRFANPSAEALRAEHGRRLLEIVRGVAARGAPDGSPLAETVQPVSGQETTWRVGVAGVPLPDGSRGLVAVVDDVTDLVRMDRLRQLNQLARIVAHEVKNPLTPIRLWVQELEAARRAGHPEFEELAADACREIALQVDRLQDTANSFSNLVALERWQSEVFDLGELVTDTLGGLTIYQRRGIGLVADRPAAGGCTVRADRQWLQRALGNLVKNSVDAIGEAAGEVRVRVRRSGDAVTLEVDDTAGGLPDHQLQDLFSPHFSTTTSGSGLGLALVDHVVTRCHGRVTAANGERGLVVRIELPAADPGL